MTRSTPSNDAGLIRVEGVHKSYAAPRAGSMPVAALRGATLVIDEPGFFAVMGRSGSGKSTLLHLIAGLDRPDQGVIEVSGARIDRMNERELVSYRRRGVGVVFQQFNLIATMDALANVILPGVLDGRSPLELRPRGLALLAELGIADHATHRPEALSGGEQQRVAIARALLFEPPVILADEPTGSLDSASSQALWRLLGSLATARRLVVLMVTHEPDAAAHCRRTFVLKDGVVAGAFESHGLDPTRLATCAADLAR